MKLREIFEGYGSAVINGIDDLIRMGGRASAKTAEKEVGAIAKPETKVVAQAKIKKKHLAQQLVLYLDVLIHRIKVTKLLGKWPANYLIGMWAQTKTLKVQKIRCRTKLKLKL